jgi:hypothetical protein
MIHHRVHNSPPLVPILSQINGVHPFSLYLDIPIRILDSNFTFGRPIRVTCPAHLIFLDLIT